MLSCWGQPVKWDRSSSCWSGLRNPVMWRKQSPLSISNTVLHLCTFPQLGFWKGFWFSVGVFPCCHYTHLNENCSCVSCVILVAAQSWGFFSPSVKMGEKNKQTVPAVLGMLQRNYLGCKQYRGGCSKNSWILFMAFQLIQKKTCFVDALRKC